MTHLPDFSHDPYRPIYHFLPPANWMNDPNGLMQYRDRYHMFYQYHPYSAYWGPMHWGHAVSTDLVHWTHLPIAMAPTPDGADKDGCWSGCAVNDDGVPTFLYTGVRPQVQCLACAADSDDPNLVEWRKHEGNPVIAASPAGLGLTDDFRDPCVWREDAGRQEAGRQKAAWYMIVGSSVRDVGGIILLYRSPDLIHWEYVQPVLVGDKTQVDPLPTGTMWECPNFFRLQDRHVLMISAMGMQDGSRYVVYWTGRYENFTFKPDVPRLLDYGREQFYAPQTFLDHSQRRIMFGWLVENRSPDAFGAAGWAGVMSLPRVLTLRPDGTLNMSPAPEVRSLRGKGRRWENLMVIPESSNLLGGLQGDALEIRAEFAPGAHGEFGLAVRCSPDGRERTTIFYNVQTQQLAVDLAHSSLSGRSIPSGEVGRGRYSGELALSPDEPLVLDVFLDRSVIEVYANERVCISCRVYPTLPESQGIDLWTTGEATVNAVDVWEMAGVW